MRSLPPELMTEFYKECSYIKHLFEFEWDQNYYFTDNDVDIFYDGKWYQSRGISFDSISLSTNPKIDSVQIEISDPNKVITNLILSNSIIDKPARIYLAPLDNNLSLLGAPVLLFMGYCDASSKEIGRKTVSIEIYNHMVKWKRITPRRVTSNLCMWEFKHSASVVIGTDSNLYRCKKNHISHLTNRPITGANWSTFWESGGTSGQAWIQYNWYLVGTCRYSGAQTWCDKSWERCAELSNTINFGGFKWIPGMQGQPVWWGSSADPVVRAYIAYKSRGH